MRSVVRLTLTLSRDWYFRRSGSFLIFGNLQISQQIRKKAADGLRAECCKMLVINF
jgi:hypothetical protein